MSGEVCGVCFRQSTGAMALTDCGADGCPARERDRQRAGFFAHFTPQPPACAHTFTGWRPFADGNGGEAVCSKCGLGAFAHTMQRG